MSLSCRHPVSAICGCGLRALRLILPLRKRSAGSSKDSLGYCHNAPSKLKHPPPDILKALVLLCHPDRHPSARQPAATKAMAWINQQRRLNP